MFANPFDRNTTFAGFLVSLQSSSNYVCLTTVTLTFVCCWINNIHDGGALGYRIATIRRESSLINHDAIKSLYKIFIKIKKKQIALVMTIK